MYSIIESHCDGAVVHSSPQNYDDARIELHKIRDRYQQHNIHDCRLTLFINGEQRISLYIP